MLNNTPLIITIVVLAILIALSWYLGYRRKIRLEKLEKDFDVYAFRKHLSIDKKQTLNRNMIGIDRKHKKLLFLDRTTAKDHVSEIDLSNLQACDIVRTEEKNNGLIKSISLRCTYKNDGNEILLPFYSNSLDRPLRMMRLSKKAAYWMKTINLFKSHH